MKPDPRIFDDLARMAGGAVNIVSGLQQQVREEIRSRVDEMLTRMDLVPREDFERLEAMVAQLRLRQEELEQQIGGKKQPAKKSPAPKAKKPPAKKKKK
jgi:BMFP domain-containing protein YqiC